MGNYFRGATCTVFVGRGPDLEEDWGLDGPAAAAGKLAWARGTNGASLAQTQPAIAHAIE